MTIVRLDRALLQQPQATDFVDVSNDVIPKLQNVMDKVGNKYDDILQTCNNDTLGYCNDIPLSVKFTTVITEDEFQTMVKTMSLKPITISNNTWFSNIKYEHQGCFPPSRGFQLDASKSDNYCYYGIIVERK
jgi:hypothetical protein